MAILAGVTDRDDAGLRAWRAMLLAYNAAMRAIDLELARADTIPLTWYDVLLELRGAPDGRLQMQELGRRVVLSRTRVSRLVDDMAQHGLVDKVRDEADRRVVWATITPDGVRALRSTAPLYLRGIENHFSAHLTAREKTVLAAALAKVAAAHTEGIQVGSSTPPAPGPARPAAARSGSAAGSAR
jgi:DNA-binding MarR family transcriptional regulator